MEPLVDALARTLDDTLEPFVRQLADRFVSTTLRGARSTEPSLTDAVSEGMKGKTIQIPADVAAQARRASAALRNELANVQRARGELFRAVAPGAVKAELNGNLSVTVNWRPVPDAQVYRVDLDVIRFGGQVDYVV